jgi:hypothetical protein
MIPRVTKLVSSTAAASKHKMAAADQEVADREAADHEEQ